MKAVYNTTTKLIIITIIHLNNTNNNNNNRIKWNLKKSVMTQLFIVF